MLQTTFEKNGENPGCSDLEKGLQRYSSKPAAALQSLGHGTSKTREQMQNSWRCFLEGCCVENYKYDY